MLGGLLQFVASLGLLFAAVATLIFGLRLSEGEWQPYVGYFAGAALATLLSWSLRRLGLRLQGQSAPAGLLGRLSAAWNGMPSWKRAIISLLIVLGTFLFFFGFLAWHMGIDYGAAP